MNQNHQTGKHIFDSIPKGKAPIWGSLLLAGIQNINSDEPIEITELRTLINSKNWTEAENQFHKIRNRSWANEDYQRGIHLELAERIAKITFNETNEETPFDKDSGHHIYGLTLELVQLAEQDFSKSVLRSLLTIFQKAEPNNFSKAARESANTLIKKVFSGGKEHLDLRSEFPANCTQQKISLKNERCKIHSEHEHFGTGTLECQLEITYKSKKIGYYALFWDNNLEVIDDFLILKGT